MKVKEKYLNFYYETIGEIEEPKIDPKKTALLIVDLQNEFVLRDFGEALQFIVTDQCVASTVRGLADAGYNVICVEDAVIEAENVIDTLLDFSSRDEKGSEMIHIGTLINQILLLSKKEIISKGIAIYKDIDNDCYVHSNKREAIKVILQNIIINAIQGAGNEGKIEIKCYQQNSSILIFIKDNGPGINEADRENIFKPFFTTREGRFELADGGTIFFDEIGELNLSMQTRLLRVLQEKSFERVGSSETIKSDFRIIAATNKDLKEEVAQNRFRSDLYYRINIIPIEIPPLRDRKEDIPEMFDAFVDQYSKEMNKPINSIDEEIIKAFLNYRWPGNVRELSGIVAKAAEEMQISRKNLYKKLKEYEIEY